MITGLAPAVAPHPAVAVTAFKCDGMFPTMVGTDGDDTLTGTNGRDVIVGLDGNDTIHGMGGDDVICGGEGNDTIDGGTGSDFASFDDALTSVHADLSTGKATGQGTDTLVNIENLSGGHGADDLRGNGGPNHIVADQSDVVEGRGGNDLLDGAPADFDDPPTITYNNAPGPVTVDLGTGRATGAAGTDTIRFAFGELHGSKFDDHLTCAGVTGVFGCVINGLAGNDVITGSSDGDLLRGGPGNDRLIGNGGADSAGFEAGGPVHVNLGTGTSTGQGTDTMVGIGGVIGSSGDDTIVGGTAGFCSLSGGPGNDHLSSSGAPCNFFGDEGNDTITGTPGVDFASPGPGNDTVDLGAGDDDVFDESADTGNDRIAGGQGFDTLDDSFFKVNLQANLQTGVVSGAGTDSISGFEQFESGAGDDVINGSDGPDEIDAGNGNDIVVANGGDDVVRGGNGNDTIDGNAGNDIIDGSYDDDMLFGDSGTDTLLYENILDNVTADLSTGVATGQGNDQVHGFENVTGSLGNDVLKGDAGPNVIDGGAGTDTCVGNGGVDTFTNCP